MTCPVLTSAAPLRSWDQYAVYVALGASSCTAVALGRRLTLGVHRRCGDCAVLRDNVGALVVLSVAKYRFQTLPPPSALFEFYSTRP